MLGQKTNTLINSVQPQPESWDADNVRAAAVRRSLERLEKFDKWSEPAGESRNASDPNEKGSGGCPRIGERLTPVFVGSYPFGAAGSAGTRGPR